MLLTAMLVASALCCFYGGVSLVGPGTVTGLSRKSRHQERVKVWGIDATVSSLGPAARKRQYLFYFPWKISNESKVKRIPGWSPHGHHCYQRVRLVFPLLSFTLRVTPAQGPLTCNTDVQCPETPIMLSKPRWLATSRPPSLGPCWSIFKMMYHFIHKYWTMYLQYIRTCQNITTMPTSHVKNVLNIIKYPVTI